MSFRVPYEVHTNGKLLLAGEYFVLDGALALALPVRFGQRLMVTGQTEDGLQFFSFDHQGQKWFEGKYSLPDLEVLSSNDQEIAGRLQRILKGAFELTGQKVKFSGGFKIETHLEFPREWGLGTSSTLIAGIASWLEIDPFELLWKTFGGSGYDIACAMTDSPLFYQIKAEEPIVEKVRFSPEFKDHLYFVYLGQKQSSKDGISRYRSIGTPDEKLIGQVSQLTKAFSLAKNLTEFEGIIHTHEQLVGDHLELKTAKEIYFEDYPGVIKSLGAWGGDFVLATSPWGKEETVQWFNSKGFDVVFRFEEMIFGV